MPVLDTSLDTGDPSYQHLMHPYRYRLSFGRPLKLTSNILTELQAIVMFKLSTLQETLTAPDSMECTLAASLESATRTTPAPMASRHPPNAPRGSTTQTSQASVYGHETLAGGKTGCLLFSNLFLSMTDHHSLPYSQG